MNLQRAAALYHLRTAAISKSAGSMPPYRQSFTVALTCISRVLLLRDRVLGWTGPGRRGNFPDVLVSTHSITSGNSLLDAVFVEPALVPAQAAVLLCHGIGETVDHWFQVQRLLAVNGVASLLFDFSGYGKSTGRVDWSQFEDDAVAAFECMQRIAPALPHWILGFSLGSGIAAAVVNRVAATRLVLFAGFTSFRDAARSVGLPAILSPLVPPIWSAEESLHGCDSARSRSPWREGRTLSCRNGAQSLHSLRAKCQARHRARHEPQPAFSQAAVISLAVRYLTLYEVKSSEKRR